MTARRWLLAALAAFVLVNAGCVDRRFVVTSNVPGAGIEVDGQPLGPTPVDAAYVYTGKREFRATAPGYEPLTQVVKFEPKWWDYPILDLFAEVLWPFRIEDVRRVHLELQPAVPRTAEEIIAGAEVLKARGLSLPPPSVPNDQPSAAALADRYAGMPLPPTGSTAIPAVNLGRFNNNFR
ncbi:MAG: PEGA domain-containing protein [Fimbriiglobus sp.]|jgi:hypothetical protein|nr:PEGA domain-containing protein [Fimbriiglobus sp.]